MKKLDIRYERRDARGLFREYLNGTAPWRSVNAGVMKKGAFMGNHYHKKNITAFFLLAGKAEVLVKDVRKKTRPSRTMLTAAQGMMFFPYETHVVRFLVTSSFLLVKSEPFNPKSNDLYDAKLL